MARRKPTPFAPWESRNATGIEKRYIRLASTQLCSEVMRSLTPTAFMVYTYMRLESGGKKQFEFPYNKYRSFVSRPTFFRVLKELQDKGFVTVVQRNKCVRQPNIYSFSEGWKSQ